MQLKLQQQRSSKQQPAKSSASAPIDSGSEQGSDGEVQRSSSHRHQSPRKKGSNKQRPNHPNGLVLAPQQQQLQQFDNSGSSKPRSPTQEHAEYVVSLATPPRVAAELPAVRFAGPAYTNSPTPDSLPIPTSSLLAQHAAESLRSRLMI